MSIKTFTKASLLKITNSIFLELQLLKGRSC